jgi:hypothetical protein
MNLYSLSSSILDPQARWAHLIAQRIQQKVRSLKRMNERVPSLIQQRRCAKDLSLTRIAQVRMRNTATAVPLVTQELHAPTDVVAPKAKRCVSAIAMQHQDDIEIDDTPGTLAGVSNLSVCQLTLTLLSR